MHVHEHDAKDDLVLVLNASGSGRSLELLRNRSPVAAGANMFAGAASFPLRRNKQAYCTGDLDGDGLLEMVHVDDLNALHDVELDGAGGAAERMDFSARGTIYGGFHFCAIGDVDGDTDADLVIGNNWVASVLRNDGSRFTDAGTTTAYFTAAGDTSFDQLDLPALLDFSGDGRLDLEIHGRAWLGTAALAFGPGATGTQCPMPGVVLRRTCTGRPHYAYTCGESVSRIVAMVQWGGDTGLGGAVALEGGGDSGDVEHMTRGDVNGDGLDDLLTLDDSGPGGRYEVRVWLGQPPAPP